MASSAEAWLQVQLLQQRSKLPFLDEAMVGDLVSPLPSLPESDVADYLGGILSALDGASKVAIVHGYMQRRAAQGSSNQDQSVGASSSSSSGGGKSSSNSNSSSGGGSAGVVGGLGGMLREEENGKSGRKQGGVPDFDVYLKGNVQEEVLRVPKKASAAGEKQKGRESKQEQKVRGSQAAEGLGKMATQGSSVEANERGKSSRGEEGKGGKGRRGKTVKLGDLENALVAFQKGAPCGCMASIHGLVNNCLGCGKIVCEQEGEGPCGFCGALVLREGSSYAGLEPQDTASSQGLGFGGLSEEEQRAREFRDRLVGYDRSSAQRTAVIDDQSDYYEIDGDAWLTQEERGQLRQQEAAVREAEEERRRRFVVTLDLIGRKVLVENSRGNVQQSSGVEEGGKSAVGFLLGQGQGEGEASGGNTFGGSSLRAEKFREVSQQHVTASPHVGSHAPRFVAPPSGRLNEAKAGGKGQKGQGRKQGHVDSRDRGQEGRPKTRPLSRVQHDDPMELATRMAGLDLPPAAAGWGLESGATSAAMSAATPADASAAGEGMEGRDEEGFCDAEESFGGFDICPSSKDDDGGGTEAGMGRLDPGFVPLSQGRDREGGGKGKEGQRKLEELLDGLVVMRGWLGREKQIQLVEESRSIGLGPGGFYKPKFKTGGELRLHMMCLGRHWEPNLRAYTPRRAYFDNAEPPPVPASWSAMVAEALAEARNFSRGREQSVPGMKPDVCIVNFYERSGGLGIHQDKDESEASIRRGAPVVSFSLGDSAEFLFGRQRDPGRADKIVLESGDVLVFGGPARMLFHGVEKIYAETAPDWLVAATGLRSGRLNLTFREL